MTDKQLDRLMRGWRRWLGLADWKITVEFCDRDTLRVKWRHNRIVYGSIEMYEETKWAKILVCDHREVPEGEAHVEPTLVHEMLHLLVDPRDRMGYSRPFEDLLDHTADDLIRRRAAGEKCPIRRA